MNIALFHNTPSGGAKRAIYEWTRWLAVNHTIDVYTLSSADHAFCDIRPLVRHHYVFAFTPHKLFQRPWGRLNQGQRWRDLGELQQIGQRIARQINAGAYDVIFANTCLYTFMPAFLGWVQKPALYYLHEPFGQRFTRHLPRPYLQPQRWHSVANQVDPFIRLYNQRLHAIQHNSLRHTQRLLANSRFTQEQMAKSGATDIQLCYCGVDPDKFYPLATTQREEMVLSVGELSPRKGFDFLIESLAQLPADKRPTLKLACNMVQPAENEYIRALARARGVAVQILTNLTVDQLRLEYNRAQVCVYAPVMEPFGLVPLEAMACGTPVIGVREGGVAESVVHAETGHLTARDPREFAAALQALLSNHALRQRYGANARAHVLRHWTWDQASAALEAQLVTIGACNQPKQPHASAGKEH